MKPEQKKYLLIGGIVIVLLVIGYWLFGRTKQTKTDNKEPLPTEMIIPTVDASVKVSLDYSEKGKQVILKIENSPNGTESVDYELSYNTAQQGLQGVIGTVTDVSKSVEKELTLGTCSSGTCIYHEVVGKIKLSLKFNGTFGEKIFEKEYKI